MEEVAEDVDAGPPQDVVAHRRQHVLPRLVARGVPHARQAVEEDDGQDAWGGGGLSGPSTRWVGRKQEPPTETPQKTGCLKAFPKIFWCFAPETIPTPLAWDPLGGFSPRPTHLHQGVFRVFEK